jgi:transposase
MNNFAVFVGVDWGSQSHQVCALDEFRNVLLEKAVTHSGPGLAELVRALLGLVADPSRIAVAIEVPRGPVVETLLEQALTVFAINPKQLDRFRDRHTTAGAKDDRRDALVLADSLRTDIQAFRRVELGTPQLVQLRDASRVHDELKAEWVALANRLREHLQRYFPQLLSLDSIYEARWLWDLLDMAPTPRDARELSVPRLSSLLRRYRIRTIKASEVRERLQQEPLHVGPGVAEACQQRVTLLTPRLRIVFQQKLDTERRIDRLLEELSATCDANTAQSDVSLLRSLPGLGKLVCAALLAEAAEPITRRDLSTLRSLCGVAPVTKQSGKYHAVHMRASCNHRLRNAVHFWAANAIQRDDHYKARYAALRAAGQPHARALRGIGDRLLATMIAVLKSHTPYDPSRRRRTAIDADPPTTQGPHA